MNILSLFDWISCGRLALERAWIKVDKYFASEVDKYAIQIAKKNYPDTIHIGSVTGVKYSKIWTIFSDNSVHTDIRIDMIIWWSPCQDLSIAKKDGKWLQGEKSWLFFEYVRLLKEVKPKYFLLENVASMKKADKEEITRVLTEIYPDVQCYLINSALVSAQNRKRLYWTNIQWVEQPEDKWIVLKDILEENVDDKLICKNITMIPWWEKKNTELKFLGWVRNKDWAKDWKTLSRNFSQWDRVYSPEWKSVSLSANGGGRWAKTGLYEVWWVALRNRGEWKKPEFNGTEKANSMTTVQTDSMVSIRVWQFNSWWQWDRVYSPEWKSVSLSANGGGRGAKTWLYQVWQPQPYPRNYNELWLPRTEVLEFRDDNKSNSIITNPMKNILQDVWCIRKLTPIECERLQTLKDNYTEWISNTQRYKAIWNWWTVDVIAHIFSYIK